MKLPEKIIRQLLPKIQRLVDKEFENVGWHPEPNSGLDQVNLLGGDKVVLDYLDFGEYGLAFDHLNYMIEATEIKLDSELLMQYAKVTNYFMDRG